jgi:hypothetical protein
MNLEGNPTKKQYLLPISGISVEDGFNVRFDYGDMEGLEQSILDNGLIEAISVRQESGTTFLTNGHRRLRAVTNLLSKGHKTDSNGKPLDVLLCTIEPKSLSRQEILAGQILHNDGKPYSQLEEGLVMHKMREEAEAAGRKLTNREIAAMTGRREAEVSNRLILANTDPKIQKMLRKGQVSENTVLDVTRKEDDQKKQVEILEDTLKNNAKQGKTRVTGQDVLSTMINKGTVNREPSQKARLRALYDEKLSGSNAESVKVVEVVLSFLDKKATEKDVLAAIGLSVESKTK